MRSSAGVPLRLPAATALVEQRNSDLKIACHPNDFDSVVKHHRRKTKESFGDRPKIDSARSLVVVEVLRILN